MGELFDSVFLYFSGLLEVVLEIIFYGRFVGKRGTAIQNILFVVLGCVILLRYLGAKQQQRDGNSLCHTDSGDHAALLWRF